VICVQCVHRSAKRRAAKSRAKRLFVGERSVITSHMPQRIVGGCTSPIPIFLRHMAGLTTDVQCGPRKLCTECIAVILSNLDRFQLFLRVDVVSNCPNSCFSKIQIGSTFLVPADLGSPGRRVIKWMCVCITLTFYSVLSPFRFIVALLYRVFYELLY